jgi:hypothetical protein
MSGKNHKVSWILGLLVAVVALRQYFVMELLAAFSLFSLVFAAFLVLAAGLYTAQKVWNIGLNRVIGT